MNEQEQRGKQWLERLLEEMGFPASVTVKNVETVEGLQPWLEIDGSGWSAERISGLIGDRGKTIDAIQYLANTLLNISVSSDLQQAFAIELAGYRAKRQTELQALVVEIAERVRETGQPETLEYLSSAERRQVHNLFKEYADLLAESHGVEPNRRLVVSLAAEAEEPVATV